MERSFVFSLFVLCVSFCCAKEPQAAKRVNFNIVEAVALNDPFLVKTVLADIESKDLNKRFFEETVNVAFGKKIEKRTWNRSFPMDCLVVTVHHGEMTSGEYPVPLIGKVGFDNRILMQKKDRLGDGVSVKRLMISPLQLAIKNKNLKIVDLLLRAGALPNAPSTGDRYSGEEPLFTAITSFNIPIIKRLLESPKIGINQDYYGPIPLHMSVAMLDMSVTKLLLKAGADPNVSDLDEQRPRGWSKDGYTPLHRLARGLGHVVVSISGLGPRHKAHLDLQQRELDDPKVIQAAAEIIELLVEHGADINAKTPDGKTPLDLAKKHFPGIIPYLKRAR